MKEFLVFLLKKINKNLFFISNSDLIQFRFYK